MIKKLIFSITVLFALSAQAQSTDIARVEYMYIPFGNSDNAVGRFRALLQVPIPLDKELNKILVAGFEYRNVNIDIKDAVPAGFNIQDVSSLHRISGYVGYVWKYKENWRFGVKVGTRINSNIVGSLVTDDWIYTASVYAINDMKEASTTKPYRCGKGIVILFFLNS